MGSVVWEEGGEVQAGREGAASPLGSPEAPGRGPALVGHPHIGVASWGWLPSIGCALPVLGLFVCIYSFPQAQDQVCLNKVSQSHLITVEGQCSRGRREAAVVKACILAEVANSVK